MKCEVIYNVPSMTPEQHTTECGCEWPHLDHIRSCVLRFHRNDQHRSASGFKWSAPLPPMRVSALELHNPTSSLHSLQGPWPGPPPSQEKHEGLK